MPIDWIYAALGGVLIGISVSIMLAFNGRVTGISGIVSKAMEFPKNDFSWRFMFILGLIVGGGVLALIYPQAFLGQLETSNWTLIVAGLLVGFGTSLGSGCTSGHGVCGISRFSIRSVIATCVFIGAGVLSVALFRILGVFS